MSKSYKILALTGVLLAFLNHTYSFGQCGNYNDIFITEVYDSEAGNGWYMEIYNPFSYAVDLDAAGTDYQITRRGDINGTVNRTIDLTGTIPAKGLFVLFIGDATPDICALSTYDFTDNGAGINEVDDIRLQKNGIDIDRVHTPNEKGYSILRDSSYTTPNSSYIASEWNTITSEFCDNLGIFNPVPGPVYDDSVINPLCDSSNAGYIQIFASNGTAPYQYSIDNMSSFTTDSIFSSLTAGTYETWIKDASGCITEGRTIELAEGTKLINPNPLYPDSVKCKGSSDGNISIGGASGGSGHFSIWYNSSFEVIDSGQTSPLLNVPAGKYYVEMFLRDGSGYYCPRLDSTIVEEPATSVFMSTDIFNNISDCEISNASINLNGSGGSPPYTYSIDNGVSFPSSTGNFSGLGTGTYTPVVKDSKGCLDTGTTHIATKPISVSFDGATSTDPNCYGTDDGTITVSASLSAPGSIYYSIDNGSTFTDTSNVFEGLPSGSYQIMVRDSLNGACTDTGTIEVLQPAIQIEASTTVVQSKCFGDSAGQITITATGGSPTLFYSIDGGFTYSSNNEFNNLDPGTYIVWVQDSKNCEIEDTTIKIINAPAIFTSLDSSSNITCFQYADGEIYSSASGGTGNITISLLVDSTIISANSDGSFTDLGPDNYFLYAEDSVGCSQFIDSVSITQPNNITGFLGPDIDTCLKETSLTLSPSIFGFATYDWDNGISTSSTYTIDEYGTYELIVTDSTGCIYADSIEITDNCPPEEPKLNIPKAFTPNGDGKNDELEIFHQFIAEFEIYIYNQWGERMYHSTNIEETWDGTYNGKEALSGTYAWKVIYIPVNDPESQIVQLGNVTIIR